MIISFLKWARFCAFSGVLCSISQAALSTPSLTHTANGLVPLRHMVAQKLLIDLRYYCDDVKPRPTAPLCQHGMTSLPPALAGMLALVPVGGVILFADNIVSSAQTLNLTHDLQQATLAQNAQFSETNLPLYIAIDQEGGRVSRLPSNEFLGFSGNMAIGATFHKHGVKYAEKTAQQMADVLYTLGFNVNFAPSVDVNSNPDNPIINVRAFSQSPEMVAQLGSAQIRAYQSSNIAAAAKHFPGHGDTHVDSHVGLPRVEHSRAQIEALDLFPFQYAIEQADVDMIMTAHIQYPALDDATFRAQNGIVTELPATLSHKILSGLLREELQYQGLIVTDALDMAAISQFLTPLEATVKAFQAGADIALMPFRISSEQEAKDFQQFVDELTSIVAKDAALQASVEASYRRIVQHKLKRNMLLYANTSFAQKQKRLKALKQSSEQLALAQALANDALTELKPLTAPLHSKQRIYAVMPDKRRCDAMRYYLSRAKINTVRCVSLLSEELDETAEADVVIIGDATPALSFFESRAFEGIEANQRKNPAQQQAKVNSLLNNASDAVRVLITLRSPYITSSQYRTFDGIYASYDYQVSDIDEGLFAPSFSAFVARLIGQYKAQGVAPVDVILPEKSITPAPIETSVKD